MSQPLREERDPAFWRRIGSHPACAAAVDRLGAEAFAALAADERVLPLASAHGGFLLLSLDTLGRGFDLHVVFTPGGWGREAHCSAKAMLSRVFATAQFLTVHETADNRMSRPPRSFGFVPCGPFATTSHGDVRTWILTRDAWRASPAFRRA